MREELDCKKEMYKLAKKTGLLGRASILGIVVEGYRIAIQVQDRWSDFKADAEAFRKVGVQLETIIHGKEHPTSFIQDLDASTVCEAVTRPDGCPQPRDGQRGSSDGQGHDK